MCSIQTEIKEVIKYQRHSKYKNSGLILLVVSGFGTLGCDPLTRNEGENQLPVLRKLIHKYQHF